LNIQTSVHFFILWSVWTSLILSKITPGLACIGASLSFFTGAEAIRWAPTSEEREKDSEKLNMHHGW
jgi:hypothetical protein